MTVGADIDRSGDGGAGAHLAARTAGHIDDIHRQTALGQPQSGGQTADPGADDDDMSGLRVFAV